MPWRFSHDEGVHGGAVLDGEEDGGSWPTLMDKAGMSGLSGRATMM